MPIKPFKGLRSGPRSGKELKALLMKKLLMGTLHWHCIGAVPTDRPTVRPSVRPPKIIQKSSKIQFAFNKVGPIFCVVKATILGHILASFGIKLVGF